MRFIFPYVTFFLLICFTTSTLALAQNSVSKIYAPPKTVNSRSSAEYYSTNLDNLALIKVNIWGEVREPGIHYIPIGSTLLESLGAAGGPKPESAKLPYVTVVRENSESSVDLFDDGRKYNLQSNDTIIVESSFRRNYPLIISGISVLISALTFAVVTSKK